MYSYLHRKLSHLVMAIVRPDLAPMLNELNRAVVQLQLRKADAPVETEAPPVPVESSESV
jgi:hypothetical protein